MKAKALKYSLIGIVFMLACSAAGIFIGSVNLPAKDVLNIFLSKIPMIGKGIPHTWQPGVEDILLKLRFPRVLLGIFVGASLAVAGAVFQGLLRNPLAEPYLLGISSGAALGTALVVLLNIPFYLFFIPSIPLAAFCGGLVSMFLVYALARTRGKLPVQTLLLSGVVINFSFSAIIMLFITVSNKGLAEITFWMLGSLNNANFALIPYISGGCTLIMGIIYLFANDLNVISMGEETAVYLGVAAEKVKKLMFVLTSLLTGLAVSVSGLIGFVGLIVPHIARLIVGPDHRVLLPFAAFLGAGFLVLADVLCRTLFSPVEIPIGVVTSILGGPFFLYLLKRKK